MTKLLHELPVYFYETQYYVAYSELFVLQMSTEIAKSFTSKDIAETFPRQIGSLECLPYETILNQSQEVETADSDIVKAVDDKAYVLTGIVDLELHHDVITGREVDSVTQLLGIIPTDVTSSDYSISYDRMIPPTGLVFGDPLPWNLPSDGIGFVDKRDIVEYTESQILMHYELDMDTESDLLPSVQEFELQFPTENVFPAAEPFFV